MRILSWNINGVRTLPQYHPWNTFKTFEGVLEELKADIICFQEMKTSRTAIQQTAAIPGHFDAFFSFPVHKGGYSGVAVYTDSRTVIPLKAEEGLSGRIQPKPPLSVEERISSTYPQAHEMELVPDEQENTPSDLLPLDSEGRALVLDFGLFVLINVYCPNETSDARLPFKMNYHLMLQERVAKLISDGREVIVLGDMNICATPLDHCDGHLPSHASMFYDHPARRWFRDWLEPIGPMIDAVRKFWPDRDGMYTCWNMKLCARETNYGTRVDYILTTPGLAKWLKHGDTLPSVKGSDHCPLYIDLHEEITRDSGEVVTLHDAMQFGTRKDPPRLASRFWPEYSGKQKLLSSFFAKGANGTAVAKSPSPPKMTAENTQSLSPVFPAPSDAVSAVSNRTKSASSPSTSQPSRKLAPSNVTKRNSEEAVDASRTKKRLKPGQAKLSSFFVRPAGKPTPAVVVIGDDNDATKQNQVEADYLLACELSGSQQDLVEQSEAVSEKGKGKGKEKEAWSQLFARIEAPKCTIHQEPAKMFTVNKPGPNKGKTFFICSRPVGPGYDKGKGARPRDEVDHQYRCNFFKWAGELKRETLRQSSSKDSPGRTRSFG
ncbi:DNase I-like protein [Neolentinus lepideus HHB14362 ss-1]|uniref:DNA-(apurinic or apyrimidinic site) endonuclease n=1 Tax=Neolentinus lepideus HHB14362 ss-1 TaxID=1314782 RepID=A0A165SI79_9AGAM|nr:DNase I-like protein [Neolentinus lepideus HHB14362 ss-1]